MKLIYLLFLVSFSFSQTHSKQIEKYIFNYQFDAGFKYMDEYKSEFRKPTYGLFRAVLNFYRYFSDQPSDRNKRFIDDMVFATKAVTEREDEILEAGVTEDILMLGGCQGFEAMGEFLRKNRFSALRLADRANTILEELYENDTTAVDALFGMGIYNYALSKPPKILQWVLAVLGYSGDYDLGIKYLKKVGIEGTFTNVQSLIFLINHSLYERKKYDFVYPLLNEFTDEFKQTPMFLYKSVQLNYYMKKYFIMEHSFSQLNEYSIPSYVYSRSRLFLAKSYIERENFTKAESILNSVSNAKKRLKGSMYYDLRETYADNYFAQKMYKKAHAIFISIYEHTNVDRRRDRIELKLEKIEDLTENELSY